MINLRKWSFVFCGILLLVTYFLPWVNWGGTNVSGYALATGKFFQAAEAKLYLSNPFPKLSFLFLVFWLIPVLSIGTILLSLSNPWINLPSIGAGVLSLCLVTLFVLFTGFGTGKYFAPVTVWAWLHALSAITLLLSAQHISMLKRLLIVFAGPVIVYGSFKVTEKYMMGKTYKNTAHIEADYTIEAPALIQEFLANDTAANKRYTEKILQVNGAASSIAIAGDSTSTIKFGADSYLIFSFDKTAFTEVKKIKAGDVISVKGVCSGSIHSEILGTTSISFKRSLLNKK
jgi:fucose 4-O-acetylase-like acetyltransferase